VTDELDPIEEARLLVELSRDVTSTLDLQEVLERSLGALRQLIKFGGGAIALIEGDHLRIVGTDPPAPPEVMTLKLPLNEGVTGGIASSERPLYIADIRAEGSPFKAVSEGVVSYFGWPLILNGEVTGVVQIDSPEVDAFPPEVQAAALRFAPTIAAAVQNALLFEKQQGAIEMLQSAEFIKKEFMSIISHELRTPLAAILGFAETLATSADRLDFRMIQEAASRVVAAGHRLEVMINDLLDLSDLEQGLAKINPTPTSVSSILRDMAIDGRGKSHGIVLDVPDDLPNVLADPGRLYQALQHLLENAKRFSSEGSEITISAKPVSGAVAITVRDEGRGIPEDKLPNVFQPFFQVEESQTRTVGGLGVGLYMVKGLCAAMNADISVESKVGEGSAFTITVPIAERAADVDLGTTMCVWAHPDDESYLTSGVMQQAVADGRRVVCVTATRGEGGSQDAERWPPEKMAEIREIEIAESLRILGVSEHHWLDYIDGHCHEVDDEEAIAKIVALIESVQPASVFTFGPDGHTGHEDHIAVSRWTTEAFRRAAPSGAGLYYATVTPEWADQWCPVLETYNVFAPGTPVTTPREELGVACRLSPEQLETKIEALRAQISQTQAFFEMFGMDMLRATHVEENFKLGARQA
jgi:signal transduction histidine kinase/LmbE family N-acetylglucosaminyl deacetylase